MLDEEFTAQITVEKLNADASEIAATLRSEKNRLQELKEKADEAGEETLVDELQRVEKDIILNFNNTLEVAAQREIWAKTLASLRAPLAAVRTLKADDAGFIAAIDKTLEEVKQYEDGVSPVFAQIEAAQLDGAGGAA